MTMVGDEYVLAMMLPHGRPWSEEEQGMPFWHWFEWVFSRHDSTDLWNFMGDPPDLLQQDEHVTAYPKKANSHPLMKDEKGFDARLKPPDTVPIPPERLRQAHPPQRAKPQQQHEHATNALPEVAGP